MNLNTLLRHGVLDQPEGVSLRFSTGSECQPDANAFRLITSQKEMVTMVDYVADRIDNLQINRNPVAGGDVDLHASSPCALVLIEYYRRGNCS